MRTVSYYFLNKSVMHLNKSTFKKILQIKEFYLEWRVRVIQYVKGKVCQWKPIFLNFTLTQHNLGGGR